MTTVYTCECGTTHRSPNPHVLVRYGDETGHRAAIHYSRAQLGRYLDLPHEHKLIERTVPFCEACFAGARATERVS